jgi:3-hydroxy-9,10-secoandrosta-1,3,5(10)-triene-9,17-dione monooxygenase reductase component
LTTGLDQARFREVLGHFATGITIVTALEDGLPVGFSCQSFAALSLDPPMVVLAPARTSTSWPRIRAAGLTGAPVIDGSLAVVECELGEIFDGGDHEIVTGRVVALDVNEGGPLLFYRGGFGRFVS